jgi:hypothetical protein
MGRGSSVDIASRYGLDGPGIESRWRARFSALVLTGYPPSLLYNRYRVFLGGKAAGVWRWPPTPSSAEVKERVQLYRYSPLRVFVACYMVNFTFTFTQWKQYTERTVLALTSRTSKRPYPNRIKANSHIPCRSHAVPMMFPCHAVPLRV